MTQSWIEVAPASDFPIENLPFGVFSIRGDAPRPGIAIGAQVLDLRALATSGMLDGACDRALLEGGTLNALFAADGWRGVRARVGDLLRAGGDPALRDAPHCLLYAQNDVTMHVPVAVGDYVDFYSSLEHATNLGRLFRPDGDPLLPNWRWIPIGYHGRSSTIVIDGTPVVRPNGQRKAPTDAAPSFGPSRSLDIELELGFITSVGNALGEPIPVARAREHVAGFVLVNDWSARDIQAWEYQPLGPFLGKSFATTISPWIVTLDALEPFRVAGPRQDPSPLAYLAGSGDAAYDIHLEVSIQTEKMRAEGATRMAGDFLAHELRRHVLELRTAARARNRQRRDRAGGRPLCVGNDLRPGPGQRRQFYRDDLARRTPDSVTERRNARVLAGRRRNCDPRMVRAPRRAAYRVRNRSRTDRAGARLSWIGERRRTNASAA